MPKQPREILYCDHCGNSINDPTDAVHYRELPKPIESGNLGESATLCPNCAEHIGPEPKSLLSVSQDLLKMARTLLEESGPCDHSVNICVCGYRRIVEEAEARIGIEIAQQS